MGSYAVIAEIGEALVELLRQRIGQRADAIDMDRTRIALVSPNHIEDESDVRLSLYLYSMTKNDVLNARHRDYNQAEETATDPPLALDLHYLVTAYPASGNGDLMPETLDQHRILGLAVQTLNDNGIMDGTTFGHRQFDRDVSITLQTDTSEDAMDLWFNAVGEKPYHLSMAYTVGPVLVDSRSEEELPPVDEREMGFEDSEEEGARQESRSYPIDEREIEYEDSEEETRQERQSTSSG
jgi:hypothetical protein